MNTVLHVERSSFFQKIMRDILKPHGYVVLDATSVQEAMTLWKSQRPDVIITGMELDDGRGQDLIKALNGAGSVTPVIVVSSNESLKMREELFSLGVADYLIKQDINPERLVAYLGKMGDPDETLRHMQGLKIAILDDSKFEIQVIQSILALHGIRDPRCFTDPRELLEGDLAYDIFIIDLVLPHMSGEDVVKTIKERRPMAMIVVASSVNHAKTVAHVLDSGADDYITKPFEGQLFMARLKSIVRTHVLLHEVKRHQSELEHLARTDGLTGVLNHRSIIGFLEARLVHYKISGGKAPVVLLIDLDHFKSINDTHGHQVGDDALLLVCQHIESRLPEGSRIGRYGGEEFLIIFDNCDMEKARLIAAQTLQSLAEHPLVLPGGKGIALTYSGGLAMAVTGHGPSDIIGLADAAMYEAKRQGRNRIVEVEA